MKLDKVRLALTIGIALLTVASAGNLPAATKPTNCRAADAATLTRNLPGAWRFENRMVSPHGAPGRANALAMEARLRSIAHWQVFQFQPDNNLRISAGENHVTFSYSICANILRLQSARASHVKEHWQLLHTNGALFLRSLLDSEVITLVRVDGTTTQ